MPKKTTGVVQYQKTSNGGNPVGGMQRPVKTDRRLTRKTAEEYIQDRKTVGKRGSTDYSGYRFTKKEWLRYGMEGFLILCLIGYLFYHSLWAVLVLSPFLYYFMKEKKRELSKRRSRELNLQFKEGIQALSVALSAGFSAENAFREAVRDLSVLYGQDQLIVIEFSRIVRQLDMNEPVEKALSDFASRSGLEDVKNFAEVFAAAKRSGGDLVGIIQNTINRISDKIEVKQEITAILSAKQLEQRMMNVIPFLIILYVGFSSPGFLDILYHNLLGISIMTFCLIIYVISYSMSKKIVDIEV